jgi:hypothetical protein
MVVDIGFCYSANQADRAESDAAAFMTRIMEAGGTVRMEHHSYQDTDAPMYHFIVTALPYHQVWTILDLVRRPPVDNPVDNSVDGE